jgi:hypothetical protein
MISRTRSTDPENTELESENFQTLVAERAASSCRWWGQVQTSQVSRNATSTAIFSGFEIPLAMYGNAALHMEEWIEVRLAETMPARLPAAWQARWLTACRGDSGDSEVLQHDHLDETVAAGAPTCLRAG